MTIKARRLALGMFLATVLAAKLWGVAVAQICPGKRDNLLDPHISVVGGKPAKSEHWPFFVALRLTAPTGKGRGHYYFCGGTLVAHDTVLTAAHCIAGLQRNTAGVLFDPLGRVPDAELERWELKDVVISITNLRDVGTDEVNILPVRDVIAHDEFLKVARDGKPTIDSLSDIDRAVRTSKFDIAVIKLSRSWSTSPVPLPTDDEVERRFAFGKIGFVAGFGVFDIDIPLRSGRPLIAGSTMLLEGPVPIRKRGECAYEGRLCAGDTKKRIDACTNDSGGPLLVYDPLTGCPTQVGIISGGPGGLRNCGRAPGYYTSVTFHRDWIGLMIADR